MLNSNEIRTVRQRWTDPQIKIAREFLNGKSNTTLELTPDGLVDLRGLVIEDFIKDKRLSNVDLSACILKNFGQFGFCRLENCIFSQADLGTNLGEQFIGCKFRKANLRKALLRGEFQDCDFDSARFVGTWGKQVTFRRCNFRSVNFKQAVLLHCTFEECVFEECVFGGGSLGKAKFVRTDLTAIDFADTILDGMSQV